MAVTNSGSGTRVDEIADGIYRISTPLAAVPGGFTFNQYLIADAEPLLFHSGPRKLCPIVREAIATVVPVERLRFLALSHFEDDECGGIDELLAGAPQAVPLSSRTNAMINGGAFTRDVRGIADGESLALGRHRVRWLDAPHLPHAWECGYLFEETTRTLLCGDLFTQGGSEHPALTSADILGPSEEFRRPMDYYAHGRDTRRLLEHLAATRPTTLACMHGAAWQGDGAALLRALADSLGA